MGEQVYSRCHSNLESLQFAIQNSLSLASPLDGIVRVTSVEDMGVHILVPLIAKFGELYPNIRIELICTSEVIDLVRESIDIALRVGPISQQSYRAKKIGGVKFILVATQKYLEKFNRALTLSDLSKVEFISFTNYKVTENGLKLHKLNETKNIPVFPKYNSSSTIAILQLALLHKGVALLPDFLCEEYLKTRLLIQICKGWHTDNRNIYLATPSPQKTESAVKIFRDLAVRISISNVA